MLLSITRPPRQMMSGKWPIRALYSLRPDPTLAGSGRNLLLEVEHAFSNPCSVVVDREVDGSDLVVEARKSHVDHHSTIRPSSMQLTVIALTSNDPPACSSPPRFALVRS